MRNPRPSSNRDFSRASGSSTGHSRNNSFSPACGACGNSGEAAARRIAADAEFCPVDPPRLRRRCDRLHRRERILVSGGKAVFRAEPIVDGDHPASRHGGERRAYRVVAVEVARDEPAAVEIDEPRQRAVRLPPANKFAPGQIRRSDPRARPAAAARRNRRAPGLTRGEGARLRPPSLFPARRRRGGPRTFARKNRAASSAAAQTFNKRRRLTRASQNFPESNRRRGSRWRIPPRSPASA